MDVQELLGKYFEDGASDEDMAVSIAAWEVENTRWMSANLEPREQFLLMACIATFTEVAMHDLLFAREGDADPPFLDKVMPDLNHLANLLRMKHKYEHEEQYA